MVWPIFLGLAVVAPAWWLATDGSLIPPGDAVIIMEAATSVPGTADGAGLNLMHAGTRRIAATWNKGWTNVGVLVRDSVEGVETKARVWALSGMVGLVLLAVLLFILLFNGGWGL